MPGLPSAVLFDLDGTLVDSEPFHRAFYRQVFAEIGWPADDATLALFTGRRADDVFSREPGPWTGVDAVALVADMLQQLPSLPPPEPMPGASALVREVAGLTRLGLVTSADHSWVNACLGGSRGLVEFFGVVVTRDQVALGKPDPQGYAMACDLLDAVPSASLAVEDAPAGVTAAAAAGIGRVVGLTSTFSGDALVAAGATHIASSLAEVRALIVGLTSRRRARRGDPGG